MSIDRSLQRGGLRGAGRWRNAKRRLTVAPRGGLGNRMRVLDSAMAFAEDRDYALRVIWLRNEALGCGFQGLFELPSSVSALMEFDVTTTLGRMRWRLFQLHHYLKVSQYLADDDVKDKVADGGAGFVEQACAHSLFVSTCHRFYPTDTPFRRLLPAPWIRRQVEAVAGLFSNHTVGVHIRRGDNAVSTRNSPTESFVEAMAREIRFDSDTTFFLATDSPLVERMLRSHFPDRVVVYEKRSLDRSNAAAIQDALVDLHCLARTRKLLGSYWSSFTDTAAAIHGTERVIVH